MNNLDKLLKDMTPTEQEELINKINDDFKYFIDAAPFVEIGDTSMGVFIKLKTSIDEGKYSIFEIIFELQWLLYSKQKRNPNIKKLIVSELEITPPLEADSFHPRQGLMIKIYFTHE